MAISTPGFPNNFLSPGVYISNVPSGGGASQGVQAAMLVGQMLSGGTAVANVPVQVFAQSDVNALFGAESMLAQMFMAYRLNDPSGAVWACPVADASGTAASVTVTFAGTPTQVGANIIYVNNQPISVAVSLTDTANSMASNWANAVTTAVANPNSALGVTASATGAIVTLTSAHIGLTVGDIQVKTNKNGPSNGEWTPAGVTVTVGALAAGTVDPVLTTAFTNIQALPWTFLCCPYTTTTVNAAVETLLSDTVGRWSPLQQVYGDRLAAIRGTLTTITGYGATVGANKHASTVAIMDSQTPVYEAAAAYAGLVALNVRSNPALPIRGILQGVDAPSPISRLRRIDENTLLSTGISVIRVDNSGNSEVVRTVQEFTANSNYINLETDFLVQYVDTFIREDLETTYAQVSLLADGNPVAAGSGAVTPSMVLAHVWGLYITLEALGIVQNSKTFIQTSYVEANVTAGVVSLYLPVQVASQLRIIRILNSFS